MRKQSLRDLAKVTQLLSGQNGDTNRELALSATSYTTSWEKEGKKKDCCGYFVL